MSFPASPVNNQTAVVNNITYIYSSTSNAWTRTTSANTVIGNGTVTSVSSTTGALVVSGGAGISGNAYIGGTANIAGNLILSTITTLSGTGGNLTIDPDGVGDLIISPATEVLIQSTMASTTTSTGALVVTGGVGISGNLNTGGYSNHFIATGSISNTSALNIMGNVYGQGGISYFDFLSLKSTNSLTTNPNKYFRLNSTGGIEIINSAYTTNLFTLTDTGNLTIPGVATVGNITTTNGVFWANGIAYSTGGGSFNGGTITNALTINNATGSTSTGTGALIVTGGIGVAGNVWAGQVYSTNNGNGTNFAVGDDAWFGDINVANTTRLMGQQDATQGYLVFGNSNATNYIGRTGSNPITVTGAFTVTGNAITGNLSTTTAIATNFVGTFTGTSAITSGSISGVTGQFSTLTTTNFSTANAVLSGGSITGMNGQFTTLTATNFSSANIASSNGQYTTLTATNFSTGNAQITAGSIAGSHTGTAAFSTGVVTNFSTANAVLSGGSITGMNGQFATLTSTNFSSANIASSNGQFATLTATNFSSANIASSNGQFSTLTATNFSSANVTSITGTASTLLVTNFSTANAQITAGSIAGSHTGTAAFSTGVVTNFSTGNAQITGGSLTGMNGQFATLTATNFSSANIASSNGQYTTLTATNLSSGNLQVSGAITPNANATVNLGSATAWWATVYGVASQAKYADLAENYSSDVVYEPGTVVVFGGTREITISTVNHDSSVAGIISTKPAYLMNAEADGLSVALTGRVPCRVLGPVCKGAVLVTSDIHGVAMAIDNAKFVPGCVIGKALEPINTNTIETIEVVVGKH